MSEADLARDNVAMRRPPAMHSIAAPLNEREIDELRGFVRGFQKVQDSPPSAEQLERLAEVISRRWISSIPLPASRTVDGDRLTLVSKRRAQSRQRTLDDALAAYRGKAGNCGAGAGALPHDIR